MGTGIRSTHHKLPQWAAGHAATVTRCAADIDFRMRVLSAASWERASLAAHAERWCEMHGNETPRRRFACSR